MYARSGTLYPRPGEFDYVLRLLRDTVALAAQREPGFSGMLIMNDRQASKVVGITLWESKADMLASAEGEYLQEQVSRIITHLKKPPEFEDYELDLM
ncbi:MAG TPA: antibiotic biosynthesis monooxygenase [Rubrobacter sp.]|nr:antibiotic biosynthesis monooxygenase [Rubrobacter sp.]